MKYKIKKWITIALLAGSSSLQAVEISHEMGNLTLQQTPQKVATLDWVLTETVLSLGITPVGVADAAGYREWVSQPELVSSVIDVGSRREPNLELLAALKPDVILISGAMSHAYEQLNAIAPTLVYSVYTEQKSPLLRANSVTRSLGELFDKSKQAEQIVAQTTRTLSNNGATLRQAKLDKKLLFVRLINEKTIRVHGDGSLTQDVIAGMDLANAWQAVTNMWGFTTAGIEKLAEHQQAQVMILGPLKERQRKQLADSVLFQAMEFSRQDRVYELPAIWTFGGLISAQRLSDQITSLLLTDQITN